MTRLVLLDKLDDSLDKSVILESFVDANQEVTLRSDNMGKFTLAIQSIGHQVGTSQLLLHDIIELG